MRLLAEQHGFTIKKIDYNSWGMQFWGSEQYKMDVPLIHEKSYPVNNNSGLFTPLQIDAWEKEAKELNEKNRGAQASFYLTLAE
jgi:hypothetical protein